MVNGIKPVNERARIMQATPTDLPGGQGEDFEEFYTRLLQLFKSGYEEYNNCVLYH